MSVRVLLAGLLLLVAATTLFHVHVVRACIPSERLSLLNFKLGVVDHSNVLSSWTHSSHRDCCTWTGIRCDNRTHHVISIDLFNYRLGGIIGPSLVELQYLEHLDLCWNSFTQIPKFIGSFKSLKYLGLGENPVSGAIPSQLGNLTKLQILDLGSYDSQLIADNVEWLSHLPSLTSFELVRANFTIAGLRSFKIPPSLSTLELYSCQFPEADTSSLSHANSSDSLQTLYMYSNSIHSTTMNWLLNSSRNLVDLSLSYNPVTGVVLNNYVTGAVNPYQLGNLTKLKNLNFYAPMIVNNFEWLSDLPSLTTFTLGGTNFTKAGLESFKMPPSLSSLELSGCQFPQVDGVSSLSFPNSSNFLTSLSISGSTMHPTALTWFLNSSTNLVNLTITWCSIDGSLPNSFQKMTSLERFVLKFNERLGNQIPESLGNLTSLHALDLSDNNFNGTLQDLLESLSGCLRSSLQELDLSYNLLDGPFPNRLSQFPNLVVFKLAGNRLTGSLPDLSTLSFLREFDASDNKFNGTLAESIGELHNLESLDVSSNSLVGIVSEVHFQKLSNLRYLDLSSTSLIFRFNSNWLLPFQLTHLSFRSCKLGPEFPMWLRNQFNLSYIDLSNCSIADAIPNWFSNLTFKLQHLDLSANHIHGPLPDFPLSSADVFPGVTIDLRFNKLRGAIPPFLFKASELYLSNNSFRSLGTSFCTMVDVAVVEAVDLSNNQLFGGLPDCWWKFRYLSELNLENNELFGVIPHSLGSLEYLQILRLSHNNFTGPLPSSLKNCTSLEYLDVGENNLKGKIPTWLGERLTHLVVLRIKSNKFHGSIPPSLCHIRWIQILDISLNDMSGVIPPCIYNFTSLTNPEYNFSHYPIHYMPVIPDTFAVITWKGVDRQYGWNIKYLKMIDLSSNKLTGEIPREIENLVELVQLNLSTNNLSGAIPEKIGQLNKLDSLDLSHNQLSGKIPASLATVSFLDFLDLSNNSLSGRIPTGTQLQSFNASSYAGNPELCGKPLTTVCPGDETLDSGSDDESSVEDGGEWCDLSWFRMGIGAGFAVGFFGVCGNLLLNTSWRLSYFQFLNHLGDWLYVIIFVNWAKLKRVFSIF